MKKHKLLFIGLLISCLIIGSFSVYALTGTKTIDVTYNNIKVTLDGKAVKMDAEPFEYNGVTFVPVTSLSQALGASAAWNSSTNTIEISHTPNKETTPSPPTQTTTVTPKASEKKEVIVYITKTGAKYHSSGCRYLSKSKIPISLESAKRSYSPCSVCNPKR